MGGYSLIRRLKDPWDYVKEIKDNHYVYELGKNKGVFFYIPDVRDDLLQGIIAGHETYQEADLLFYIREKYIPREAVILDIGANIGNHTVFFAKECAAKKIYAFEPIEHMFRILERNVQLNHMERTVELYNCAVGNGEQRYASVSLRNPQNLGGTALKVDETGELPVVSIDSLQIDEPIAFVKIDVEGFEVSVLEGAEHTLKKHMPVIFVEAFPQNYDKVSRLLDSYGYRQTESLDDDNYIFTPK